MKLNNALVLLVMAMLFATLVMINVSFTTGGTFFGIDGLTFAVAYWGALGLSVLVYSRIKVTKSN